MTAETRDPSKETTETAGKERELGPHAPVPRSENPASVATAKAVVADGSRTGRMRAQTPQILLDTGSTENFVAESQREKLNVGKLKLNKPVSVRTIHGMNTCLYYCMVPSLEII